MDKDESKLAKLKDNYAKIQKIHNLPEFDILNSDFSIEKLAELETDFLIREVVKSMADKFSNYLRFVEVLINPSNAQMFVFSIVKTLGTEEKEKLSEIYKELAKIELNLIELDVEFSEQKDADFIKNSYETWNGLKKDLLNILGKIKANWNKKKENNSKGYFG